MKNRDIEDDCLSLDNVKAKLQEASTHGSRPYSNAEKHLLVSFVLIEAIQLIRDVATKIIMTMKLNFMSLISLKIQVILSRLT